MSRRRNPTWTPKRGEPLHNPPERYIQQLFGIIMIGVALIAHPYILEYTTSGGVPNHGILDIFSAPTEGGMVWAFTFGGLILCGHVLLSYKLYILSGRRIMRTIRLMADIRLHLRQYKMLWRLFIAERKAHIKREKERRGNWSPKERRDRYTTICGTFGGVVLLMAGMMLEMATGSAYHPCLLYTSPSPRDRTRSRMPSSA